MKETWAEEEMRYLQLGDNRLKKRMQRILGDLSERPGESVPEASGNWAATKGVYRLWSNSQVEESAIREAHYRATRDRVVGQRRILAIQDTTDLNYTGKEVAKGLGYTGNDYTHGLLMHSVLAVSEVGLPLGLLNQQMWSRDKAHKNSLKERRKKETVDKESQRWLEGVRVTEERVPEGVEIVHIADREGDIYDLFAQPRRAGSHLLIRMNHQRRVEHESRYLWEAIHTAPVAGELSVQITQQANREARMARVQVRFLTLKILPPHQQPGAGVSLQILLVEERQPPEGTKPMVWLLATTLPVENLAEATVCIGYYTLRWLIERFHFVLKSGCEVEKLYLQTPDRLLRALSTYCMVAWRLLWLTYQARQNADLPCITILETHEWQALYCTIHKTSTPPANPPTLGQAILWIARLGGFLGRTHDGNPGPKTIWRGLRRLDDIAATWLLRNPPVPP